MAIFKAGILNTASHRMINLEMMALYIATSMYRVQYLCVYMSHYLTTRGTGLWRSKNYNATVSEKVTSLSRSGH